VINPSTDNIPQRDVICQYYSYFGTTYNSTLLKNHVKYKKIYILILTLSRYTVSGYFLSKSSFNPPLKKGGRGDLKTQVMTFGGILKLKKLPNITIINLGFDDRSATRICQHAIPLFFPACLSILFFLNSHAMFDSFRHTRVSGYPKSKS